MSRPFERVLTLTLVLPFVKMPKIKPEAEASPTSKATGICAKRAAIQRKTEPIATNTPVYKAVVLEVREDGRGGEHIRITSCEFMR